MGSPKNGKCKVCLDYLRDDGTCLWKCDPALARPQQKQRSTRARQRQAARKVFGGYVTRKEASAGAARAIGKATPQWRRGSKRSKPSEA